MYSPSILTLDSRNRINDDYPNNCQFLMQDTVIVRKIELTNFQFANTLYNVTSYSNKLYIGGVLAATMTAKFWTSASDFITNLNTQLKTFYVTAVDVVTIDTSTNILTWVLPSGSITSQTTMKRILGLVGTLAGSFTSTLFLVGPTQLALVSNQLNKFFYNSFASTLPVCGIIPVFNGFLQMNYYEPSRGWKFDYGAHWLQFNTLQIGFVDNRTGFPVEGLGEWSCTFVVS